MKIELNINGQVITVSGDNLTLSTAPAPTDLNLGRCSDAEWDRVRGLGKSSSPVSVPDLLSEESAAPSIGELVAKILDDIDRDRCACCQTGAATEQEETASAYPTCADDSDFPRFIGFDLTGYPVSFYFPSASAHEAAQRANLGGSHVTGHRREKEAERGSPAHNSASTSGSKTKW